MHRTPLLLLLISAPLVTMARTNFTVDDTLGNPDQNLQIVYQPEGSWSPGQVCTDCEARVDTSKVFDGTWHDVTYLADNPPSIPLSANLTFNGVAIYVYCIVTRASTNPYGNSDMTFYLDGEPVGVFQRTPNGNSSYEYSVPVYVNESIPAGDHTFALVNGRKGGLTALALLDYIIVSSDGNSTSKPTVTSAPTIPPTQSSAPSTQSQTAGDTAITPAPSIDNSSTDTHRTAIVAASTVAGVLVVIIVAAIAYWCLRRRRVHNSAPPMTESKWSPGFSQPPHTPSSASRFPLLSRFHGSQPESVPTPYILPLPVPPPADSLSPPPSKRKGAPSAIRPPSYVTEVNPHSHTSASSSSLALGDRVLHLTPDHASTRGIPPFTPGAPPTPFSPNSLAGIPPGSAANRSFPTSMPTSAAGGLPASPTSPVAFSPTGSGPTFPVSPVSVSAVSLPPSAIMTSGGPMSELDRACALALPSTHGSDQSQSQSQSPPQSPWSSPTTTVPPPIKDAEGARAESSRHRGDADLARAEGRRRRPVDSTQSASRMTVAAHEDANEGLPPPPYAAATAGMRVGSSDSLA